MPLGTPPLRFLRTIPLRQSSKLHFGLHALNVFLRELQCPDRLRQGGHALLELGQHRVVVGMRADPEPDDHVPLARSEGTIIETDAR